MRVPWFVVVSMTAFTIGCESSGNLGKPPEASGWDGTVQQWGTLREVMHGQISDGQIRLSQVVVKPHLYGLGAPHRLRGEIIVVDGVAWVANLRESKIETRRSSADDSAVLLAVAHVPQWIEFKVEREVGADEFDDFIREMLEHAGLEKLETIPFVVEGAFPSLKLHVLNGQCPFSDVELNVEGAGPPHRTTLENVRGLIIGFYAEKGAGRITHHWTRTHAHALVGPEDDRQAGHVDEVVLQAGAILRLPVYKSLAD